MDTPLCQTIIDSLKEYKIVVKRNGQIIGEGIEYILGLTLEDFGEVAEGNNYLILVLPKEGKKKVFGTIMISIDENLKRKTRFAVYIEIVRSYAKGMGRNLIYLITCKAAQLGLPIAFNAQPSVQDSFTPGTSEEIIREKEEKLLHYYNSLGFNRNGEEHYSDEFGLTQHYESLPKNVLSRAVTARRRRRRSRQSRRNYP